MLQGLIVAFYYQWMCMPMNIPKAKIKATKGIKQNEEPSDLYLRIGGGGGIGFI